MLETAVAPLGLVIAACGDDAPASAGSRLVDTIDSADAELAVGDEGAGHSVAIDRARTVINEANRGVDLVRPRPAYHHPNA
jgi:hypothetical protein